MAYYKNGDIFDVFFSSIICDLYKLEDRLIYIFRVVCNRETFESLKFESFEKKAKNYCGMLIYEENNKRNIIEKTK